MRNVTYLILAGLLTALAACGGGGSGNKTPSNSGQSTAQVDCSTTAGRNTFVYNTMQSWYFWYKDIPSVDPASYKSPQSLLDAIEFKPRDRFTFIDSKKADKAFLKESQFIGIGIGTKLVSSGDLRVTDVFSGSPAAGSGLARGDRILTINGQTISDLQQSGDFGTAFGPAEKGAKVSLTYRGQAGAEQSVTLTKEAVTEPSVTLAKVLDMNGRKIAYLAFRDFTTPSNDALDAAFKEFADKGATELVLDERYNGGGLLSVAEHLASLIGGANTDGKTFAKLVFNDKHSDDNQTLTFDMEKNALNLDRLIVITSGATASASELIISGLKPYISVSTVGDTSFGKPVGSNGFDFCGKVLHPITFKLENAAGFGGYFDGFAPTCPAADDLDHPLGSPDEASLATALTYLHTGRCGRSKQASARRLSAVHALRPAGMQGYGFDSMINAH